MKDIVICADAYPRVKNTLYVAARHYPEHHITVLILGSADLFKFFNLINEKVFHNALDVKYFELFHPDPRRVKAKGISKILYLLPDIIRERRYLRETYNKYLAELRGCEVYFFNRGFTDFSVVKRLSKRNKLIYISSYPTQVTPREYTPTSITEIAGLLVNKLVFGRGMSVGKLPHVQGIPHMSDKYLREISDRVIDGEERDKMLKDFDLGQYNILDTSSYRILYFDSGLLGTHYIKDDGTHRRELNNIFGIVGKHFPEQQIALKYHPGYDSNQKMIKIGNILPEYIPAEFLYNDNVQMYLGVCSSSIANVEKGLVVSLADIITFRDTGTRNQLKEALLAASHSKILFPKSMDEFEKLLVDIKQTVK